MKVFILRPERERMHKRELEAMMLKAKQDGKSRKTDQDNKREIFIVFYIFIGLFVCAAVYFTSYIMFESKTVVNSTYNKRTEVLAKRVIRGSILAKDGEVLAKTETLEDGTEQRVYPYDNLFSHVIGRMKKGATGVEASENITLLTSNTNSFEKILNDLVGQKSFGDNVVTTLDVNLQKVAYDALGNYRGAVVVMEPSTGRILAMVSKPDYNPNTLIEDWESLNSSEKAPLLNRVTQGLYPPGSTFKTLTALAYLREYGVDNTYEFTCKGEFKEANSVIHCYKNKAHGIEDIKASYYHSCNSSFANLATKIDPIMLKNVAEDFLFNQDLSIAIGTSKSKCTITAETEMAVRMQTAIGQGQTQITPLMNAMITAAVANDGVMMSPYVVERVEQSNGEVVRKTKEKKLTTPMTSEEASYLADLMRSTVTDGTGSKLSSLSVKAAGKTGSADHKEGEKAHAWFVGFAPYENPEIVVSVVVESVGTGSEYAVPIAKEIFEAYFK